MKTVLEGKKIILTRPQNQYAEWATKLTELGALPVSFPLIEINPVHESAAFQNLISKSEKYDWIIFTSANAAKYFLELLDKNHCGNPAFAVAAIGSKTAAFLEQKGFEVDFIPGIYTAGALAEAIPDINAKRVLLPRTDIADDELFSALSKRGALVDEIIVYTTRKLTDNSNKEELQNLINDGMDVITFASPSVVEAFCEMEIDKKNALIACIGPVTASKAEEKGLTPDIVATTFTADGLTKAMNLYYLGI